MVSLNGDGLRDTESELSSHNDGDGKVWSLGHDINRFFRFVKISGKSIRVENQVQSSGSICSNSWSMIFCIRTVSLWRWASSPAHSNQGLSCR